MIPLYYILQINYPNISIGLHQQVELINHNDGNGDQIGSWNVPNVEQPSVQQLADWQVDQNILNSYQAILNTHANQIILQQLEELDKKSIRSIRENDTQMIAQYVAQAAALRVKLLPMTAAGVAAANIAIGI